tara:strand:+ start:3953 stop:4480 length:528 start_codon:yes stop_codon:yes gene_type:complete
LKKAKRAKKQHYVDNERFCQEMVKYRDSVLLSKEENSNRPIMPDYIGECFIKIATHLSYKPNFINYTFRDDMISDGIENCIQYVDNFDPSKSKNPFAYFTQIIYYAFLRRIQKEKKQLYIKYKSMERAGIFNELVDIQGQDTRKNVQDVTLYANMYEFVENFEQAKNKKKKPKAK